MGDNIIWKCTYCNINPSAKSSRKCPRCGRMLTPWDLSKTPLERHQEWPSINNQTGIPKEKHEKQTEYTRFYNKVSD